MCNNRFWLTEIGLKFHIIKKTYEIVGNEAKFGIGRWYQSITRRIKNYIFNSYNLKIGIDGEIGEEIATLSVL